MAAAITSVFTSASAAANETNSTASVSSNVAPGINRIDRFVDDSLNIFLEGANAPIFSPDGHHLYLGRLGDPEPALLVVLGLDDTGRTFLVSSISNSDEGFEAVTRIAIREFSGDGTRAYATANLGEQEAFVVLARDPQTGDLSVLQTLGLAEHERGSSVAMNGDRSELYAAIPTLVPIFHSFSGAIVGYNTTSGRILRYSVDDNGNLVERNSTLLDAKDAAHELRLLDDDSRLLVSTETTLLEFARDAVTGEFTSMVQSTALPAIEPRFEDDDPGLPGPVDIVVTNDGSFVYTVRQDDLEARGGYVNAFSRDPALTELALVDQVLPDDFIDNFLFQAYPAVLTPDEKLLMVPSFGGTFRNGIVGCINAFAIDESSGGLKVMGADCSSSSGRGLATHPLNQRYYGVHHQVRNQFFPNVPGSSVVGVFEPGRILQPTNLHAAVLPTSRTLVNRDISDEPVTYFTSVLNPGDVDAELCSITSPDDGFALLRFQVTDPATDLPIDPDNFQTSFSVPAGGVQTLLITLYSQREFTTRNIDLEYNCLNTPAAPKVPGVNSVLMSASNQSPADLITGAVTLSNDGIVRLPSTLGQNVFAVSTINIGGEDEIRAIPALNLSDFVVDLLSRGPAPEVSAIICETNPGSGACLAEPADDVVRRIATDEIVTYTVFVSGTGSEVAFSPAVNRAFIVLEDSAGEIRGASSVAVTTQ